MNNEIDDEVELEKLKIQAAALVSHPSTQSDFLKTLFKEENPESEEEFDETNVEWSTPQSEEELQELNRLLNEI